MYIILQEEGVLHPIHPGDEFTLNLVDGETTFIVGVLQRERVVTLKFITQHPVGEHERYLQEFVDNHIALAEDLAHVAQHADLLKLVQVE